MKEIIHPLQIILDVGQFGQDLKIDVVGSQIEVEANHEMVPDKLGEASRWMKRKYKVPPDVKLDTVTSQLKAKGSLIINAERNLVSYIVLFFLYTGFDSRVCKFSLYFFRKIHSVKTMKKYFVSKVVENDRSKFAGNLTLYVSRHEPKRK